MNCTRCDRPAVPNIRRKRMCAMHLQFAQMMSSARRDGKTVPSREQLEALADPENKCGDCGVVMDWFRGDDPMRVASLQHYRDGSFGLVCMHCNVRHARMPGDSYRLMPKDHKYCQACKTVKPLSEFTPSRVYCKPCKQARLDRWREANRERYLAKRREDRTKIRKKENARNRAWYAAKVGRPVAPYTRTPPTRARARNYA